MMFWTMRRGTTARLAALMTAVLLAVSLAVGGPAPAPAQAQERPQPAPGASAALVLDAATGAVLYERDARTARPPASLTKMMTALVAVERAPLDLPVRTTRSYNVVPVVIGLEPGDTLTLEQALYGLLLNSGNDAAIAIAEAVGEGSEQRFVGWMNETAAHLGIADSRFKNPHGLDQDGHLASAYDMAIIGRAVMSQPTLAGIVGTSRFVVDGPPRWVFRSTNPLFGVYTGIDGIKTGFDDLAGRCLVATARRGDRRAIAVVMNSQDTAGDAASLLDYAFGDSGWGPSQRPRPSPLPLAMLRADLSAPADDTPTSLTRAQALAALTGQP